ncbi:MAG TPA: PqqD family protein [Blastocatellia bacterium]|nr:PqqD family protein [Blastocatellia bacterium]
MEKATNNSQAALARHQELVVQEMPDELLVYDLKRHKAHCLNKTAAFIWQHCDGQTSVKEMATLLGRDAGSPVDEDVVWYALDKLGRAELLEVKVDLPVKDALSRRRMIRRLGALVAVPAVVSLVAPTALAQSTVIITRFKIATGQCNNQDNPEQCSEDTCCTGGGTQRLCIAIADPPGPLVDTACTGQLCQPSGNAAPCS